MTLAFMDRDTKQNIFLTQMDEKRYVNTLGDEYEVDFYDRTCWRKDESKIRK